MNVMQILSSPSTQALGWTLLHSLWQGLVCIAVSVLVLRCMPTKWSSARYFIATAALLAIFLSSISTFIYLSSSFEQVVPVTSSFVHYTSSIQNLKIESNQVTELLQTFTSLLQGYLPFIVVGWALGTALFTLRMIGGWLTVRRLKASATPVEDNWNERLQHLSRKFKIDQVVRLAQSAVAQAPMVIGYFKPVILIPFGMIGGLSTEQLESIIVHELVHIRRHDYLVNLLQSLLEVVFFFNPFVWIISGIIRREREHCCDDAVIALYGNRLAYAHALTALEEARLSRAGLALSLAEDKNQLLNRIKRIMEKSVKPYSLRERIVPAILLITGLICASWITISSGESERLQDTPFTSADVFMSPDTTIKIQKSGRYYKKSITTLGEDGKPHEEVVEEFGGDEPFTPLLTPMHFELAIPALDAIPPIDAIPPVDMLAFPAFPGFKFEFSMTDTVPFPMGPEFHGMESKFEKFSREFETEFREKFGCKAKVDEALFDARTVEEWAKEMEIRALNARLSGLAQEDFLAQHDEQMQNFAEQMGRWAEENAKQFEELERNLRAMEVPSFQFVKHLIPELVRDGYLKEDEQLESIEINDEVIKVNGKTIKESDEKKYRELMKKNHSGQQLPHRPGRLE